jgi:DNA-binding Lrp family transcriptional regulator
LDKTDVILSMLLLANSRRSYRELADTLNLSVTAVHNRIQSLIEAGVIHKFKARIGPLASIFIHVLIFGNSKATQLGDVRAKLAKQGSVYWLSVAGGNYLYIGANLKSIAELESLVDYVKDAAEMPEPTVGITTTPLNAPIEVFDRMDKRLYKLDYEIIQALKDDSRKPTSEIADALHVSAKTVRRRLARMMNNYLIELSIDWYPDESNDIMSVFHVRLQPDADKNAVDALTKKYFPNVMFYWGFSNIPNTYLFFVWTGTTKELRDMREHFESEAAVQSATPNVIFTGCIFPTWRDQIPQ